MVQHNRGEGAWTKDIWAAGFGFSGAARHLGSEADVRVAFAVRYRRTNGGLDTGVRVVVLHE